MLKLHKTFFRLTILAIPFAASYSEEKKTETFLTESKIIEIIDSYDPDILAAKLRAEAASEAVRREKASYYPTLDAQASLVPPGSLPGSGSGLGIEGVMASPFRIGQAVGLASSLTIYDFGRTSNAVKAAEFNEKAKKLDIPISRIGVLQNAFQLYYEEILNNSYIKISQDELHQLEFIEKEISGFVATGQRSIVDRYLIKSESERVRTELSSYGQIEKQIKNRLSLFLSLPVESLAVPEDEKLPSQIEIASMGLENNPFLKKATEDVNYARARNDYAKSKNLPVIKAVASAGIYEGVRLVNPSYWAVVVGVEMPVFEGFKTARFRSGAS